MVSVAIHRAADAERRRRAAEAKLGSNLAPDSRTDEQLMTAYVAGDSAAFRALFVRLAPQLLRTMLRALYAREEANDLVQLTFLHLHRARADFDPGRPLRPWVFTIAMNLKREYFRRAKLRPETSLELESEAEPMALAIGLSQVDARRTLLRALAQLTPGQRDVIELHWLDGLDFAQVAEVVGASVSAVKVRAHRGYRLLRRILSEAETPKFDANAADGRVLTAAQATGDE